MQEAWLAFFHISAVLGWIVFASSEAALCRREWLNAAVVQRLVRLDRILNRGDLSTNYTVSPGDVITVPERTF